MDPTAQFVADLTIAVVGAAIGGFAARLVRLSPIVGYLLAGVVIGPFTPGYVANQQTVVPPKNWSPRFGICWPRYFSSPSGCC